MSLNVTSSSPICEQLRAMKLDISIAIEQIRNGEQANADASLAAIQTNLNAIKVLVNAANNSTITTL